MILIPWSGRRPAASLITSPSMGQIVEFPSNGSSASGYFAAAEGGSGPGVLVIQEWWGLVPHIRDVVDRFAAAGFSALAPDLFHGETTSEPDEAGKLMMALNIERASRDMSGSIAFLLQSDAVSTEKVGVIGFCMGGGLAMVVACNEPESIGACSPFYGLIPWESVKPDFSKLQAPLRGHFAELDPFFGPEAAKALEQELKDLGKDAEIKVHANVDHAFFNDDRPEVHDTEASAEAWESMLDFMRNTLV